MAVPKRKHSLSRTRKKRGAHYKRVRVQAVKTSDNKAYKRPHVEEYIEL
ncbi:50S ribosomal protein L32 [candidate division WWE3 bacterium RIFOXYB1_FULL_43_24]|uniref:Large ribosomal subunit protein bL32 n=1 Tax=candidate division WWE3 bacterium RIFOXYD1_FULL_43_17 TaxID=1802652 RepID=A0A1F4XBJ5_UNCKA|nr:MAG: 50S ribosomal protein L32 [candidate division WWE3 bacterium RIFOXYA1_FULL_42_9]OGC69644.1 MAG: 50S ribosomal protein L32 [candidate division WWE3 bacterium RIFOXYB1_FULL_43_24]OGC73134.1 MAG: 50S ribosomal protein L32 [candidate division WWE3 bacterium RIFOXYC1_FULL_42_13]OGC79042.1 MAG: 50S ribosomal protein L32 [candidate division WWE3 bacterium RIFOXYD1_FULL_43_17]